MCSRVRNRWDTSTFLVWYLLMDIHRWFPCSEWEHLTSWWLAAYTTSLETSNHWTFRWLLQSSRPKRWKSSTNTITTYLLRVDKLAPREEHRVKIRIVLGTKNQEVNFNKTSMTMLARTMINILLKLPIELNLKLIRGRDYSVNLIVEIERSLQ